MVTLALFWITWDGRSSHASSFGLHTLSVREKLRHGLGVGADWAGVAGRRRGRARESQGGVPGGKVIRRNSHPRDLVAEERKRFLVPLNSISRRRQDSRCWEAFLVPLLSGSARV
ncbi:hypothetical protein E2C01_033226 [Portunus trituberculatus]|uniref:Uncharacterized protein n=1 Tax=Portunus trituberculatus TaxID=210409 RepID=A0A5B7EY59_PORTR|nr:hypothetical protein [Portunus trituberculatus]